MIGIRYMPALFKVAMVLVAAEEAEQCKQWAQHG